MRAARAHGSGTALASLAAVGSLLAASSCCLPVLPFIAAAGFAGGSAFLSAARPYLLGLSVLFIGLGFFQQRRVKQCRRKPSPVSTVLLWASTVFVLVSLLFPQWMANLLAG